jgi:CRISPR-associated endonuclease Cas3-HD
MEVIAKSDGTCLKKHSEMVFIATSQLFKDSLKEDSELYSQYIDIIRITSLLHDIGKISKQFQSFLKGKRDDNLKYLHNQLGASFLEKHLNVDSDNKDLIIDSIYWHHGVLNNNVTTDDIYNILDEEDIENMREFVISILGDNYLHEELSIIDKKYIYFDVITRDENVVLHKNYIKILIRSCLVGGDRFISRYSKEELDHLTTEDIVSGLYKIVNRDNIIEKLTTFYDNTDRFIEQENIVNETGKTSIINAPAGFGKTVLGLLWGFRNNKKIIWVCPRNTVAESVYDTILKELKMFNIEEISVELYLTGEVKKQQNSNYNGFFSDIIVTNIDNFLYTSVNNNKLNNLYLTNNVNVIFDEYHEFLMEGSLFSLFLLITGLRHNITNSKTLLLSATNIPIEKYIDNGFNKDNEIVILPGKDRHYNAVHNKRYKIMCGIDMSSHVKDDDSSLMVFNSINRTQVEYKRRNKSGYIVHSKFEKDKREDIFETLLGLYGKESERSLNKPNVTSAILVQASLDISFNILCESVLSPQGTLQRIGRCDRWGDYERQSTIFISKYRDEHENKTINFLYDMKLRDLWFEMLSNNCHNRELTLNDLYQIYNNFNENNKNLIDKYIKDILKNSCKRLNEIFPIKYKNKKRNDGIMSMGSNTLRSNGEEIFVIYKKSDDTYTEPFNQKLYEFQEMEDQFKEETGTINFIKKTMLRMKDDRYDYNNIRKRKRSIDKVKRTDLKRWANKSNEPYIVLNCIYDDDYGVVNKKIVNVI